MPGVRPLFILEERELVSFSSVYRFGRVSESMERHQMGKVLCRLLIAFLTFAGSLVCVSYYRAHQLERAEVMGREVSLRRSLFRLRRSLDVYAADKGELPQSLDDLVKAGYLEEVPFDPVTSRRAWEIEAGSDPNSLTGNQGIINVRSTSTAVSSEGSTYSEW